ncbi:pirin family protein [Nocardia bovistercoris]|uniref:Pirin family protein n=1 Tax=Nocardia bovistercoris TaxID=2785916 RepID=A0A931IG85_9NOCA|nr:pirin family protein [Nocardia bovistercoris]
MSDLESRPDEAVCEPAPGPGPVAELYPAREVPLGGVRGVFVERVLPQRDLPTVGAWCFFDHFGSPTVTRTDAPPDIDPHPHIGLQTVTWPFVGRIRHRDSVGSDVEIHPAQLNLMTSGRGVAHSEYYPTDAPAAHGLQLWIALPGNRAAIDPHFEQHRDLPVFTAPGARATILIGSMGEHTSPAAAYTPIIGADVEVSAGTATELPLDPGFEHALMLVEGDLTVAGVRLTPGPLLYLGTERTELRMTSEAGAHFLLIGGAPFEEELVMWWNFVGRSHEEIVAARADWENHDVTRFPDITGHTSDQRIPAPPLPGLHLKPRKRRLGASRS